MENEKIFWETEFKGEKKFVKNKVSNIHIWGTEKYIDVSR
jgi:hypothetical protein